MPESTGPGSMRRLGGEGNEFRAFGQVSPVSTRTKCLIVLLLLMVIDTLPFPVLGAVGLYIILQRPDWFLETVQRLYAERKA